MGVQRKRLKLTRRGWYGFWGSIATGTIIWGTDVVIPDEYGCLSRELWVGPFASAAEASRQALGAR